MLQSVVAEAFVFWSKSDKCLESWSLHYRQPFYWHFPTLPSFICRWSYLAMIMSWVSRAWFFSSVHPPAWLFDDRLLDHPDAVLLRPVHGIYRKTQFFSRLAGRSRDCSNDLGGRAIGRCHCRLPDQIEAQSFKSHAPTPACPVFRLFSRECFIPPYWNAPDRTGPDRHFWNNRHIYRRHDWQLDDDLFVERATDFLRPPADVSIYWDVGSILHLYMKWIDRIGQCLYRRRAFQLEWHNWPILIPSIFGCWVFS